jgi:thioredoxin-related protein
LHAREVDLNKLIEKTKKENKILFLFMHRVGCSYCNSMEEFTLDDDGVKKELNKNYIFEHLNVTYKDKVYYKDYKGTSKGFAKYIGYDIYPTSIFFANGNKEPIDIVVGYLDEKQFLKYLKYLSSGAYKKIDFDEYEKKHKD